MSWKRYLENFDGFDEENPELHDEDADGITPIDSSFMDDDFDQEQVDKDGEMETLCSLLRKFFTISNIEAEVVYNDGHIDIFCFLEKKEKMSSIIRVFEVVDKLKRDTLQGYKSKFELWENRQGYPVMNFQFGFGEDDTFDDDDSGVPWIEDDSEPTSRHSTHSAHNFRTFT